MNVYFPDLPMDVSRQIFDICDEESRANCLAACKALQSSISEYEAPLWKEFLAQRKIVVLNAQVPRSQAMLYLKEYCGYFFNKFEEIKPMFPIFPVSLFEAKLKIDKQLISQDHLSKAWYDFMPSASTCIKMLHTCGIIPRTPPQNISQETNAEAIHQQIRFLLERTDSPQFASKFLRDAIQSGKCPPESLQMMMDKIVANNMPISNDTIILLLEDKFPESMIAPLLDFSKDLDSDAILWACKNNYSEPFIGKIISKISRISSNFILHAIQTAYPENLLKLLLTKTAMLYNLYSIYEAALKKRIYSQETLLKLIKMTDVITHRGLLVALEAKSSDEVLLELISRVEPLEGQGLVCINKALAQGYSDKVILALLPKIQFTNLETIKKFMANERYRTNTNIANLLIPKLEGMDFHYFLEAFTH